MIENNLINNEEFTTWLRFHLGYEFEIVDSIYSLPEFNSKDFRMKYNIECDIFEADDVDLGMIARQISEELNQADVKLTHVHSIDYFLKAGKKTYQPTYSFKIVGTLKNHPLHYMRKCQHTPEEIEESMIKMLTDKGISEEHAKMMLAVTGNTGNEVVNRYNNCMEDLNRQINYLFPEKPLWK